MNSKPVTPYARLFANVRKFAFKVKYPRCRGVWTYPIEKLKDGFRLDDLYERVKAADQLGWNVRLIANETGIFVQYVERVDVPGEWL